MTENKPSRDGEAGLSPAEPERARPSAARGGQGGVEEPRAWKPFEGFHHDDASGRNAFSLVLVSLMKGVVHAEAEPKNWQALLDLQARVRDHVAPLGLELIVDEAEGYAYLRQRVVGEGEPELPRLVPRRPLGFQVSLLLALLRKKLAESDAQGESTRIILSREQIADLIRVFLPDSGNEARLMDRLDTHLNKVVEMGFLRRLRGKGGRDGELEVQRILKAFVDAQWLSDFDRRLAAYTEHLKSESAGAEDAEP
jgi:hypothetical protein